MRFLFSFLLTLSIGVISAQDMYLVQQRAYSQAMRFYDLPAATQAIYQMIALKPERSDLQDSLTILFFAAERYPQAYLSGEEILKRSPDRPEIREIVALSKQNIGLIKESLSDYEYMWAKDKKLYYIYQIAILQYQLKRVGECMSSLDSIINDPSAVKEMITIRMKNDKKQNVPMKAAAYNIKGICALEMNKTDDALTSFDLALEIFPEFELAAANRQALQERREAEEAQKYPPLPVTPEETTPAKSKSKK